MATFLDLKDLGKKCFEEGRYSEAVSVYSQAAAISAVPVLHTNMALCNLKLGNWSQVVRDCDEAIRLNSSTIKAHFLKGCALTEMENFDQAIVCLKAAHDIAKEQRRNFADDITSAIRTAKKKRWSVLEERRLDQQSEIRSLILFLLKEHEERLSKVRNQNQVEEIHMEYEHQVAEVKDMFVKANGDSAREVPDYLCGKISFDIMMDPVISPSGITYNRSSIEDHLQRVGHFDPITRQKLTSQQLIPNLAMKEVIDEFVTKNVWIEDY